MINSNSLCIILCQHRADGYLNVLIIIIMYITLKFLPFIIIIIKIQNYRQRVKNNKYEKKYFKYAVCDVKYNWSLHLIFIIDNLPICVFWYIRNF